MTMAMPAAFDPLFDFDGLWTTDLAERYLPLPELPDARYECIDGRLVGEPHRGQLQQLWRKIVRQLRSVTVELLRLVDGKRYETFAGAVSGQVFESAEPFDMRFAAGDLLP